MPRAARLRSPLLWLLFAWRGRISRQVYWLTYFMLSLLNAAVLVQLVGSGASYSREAETLWPFVLILTVSANIAIAVKRLHDIGYAGFLAVALLIPVVNLAFSIWAGLVPGNPGPNAYGADTDVPPS